MRCLYIFLYLAMNTGHVIGHGTLYNAEVDENDEVETRNLLRDDAYVRDRHHIQEHLEHKVNIDLENATPTELEFHFFSGHDTDNDGKLDGLELYHSAEHSVMQILDDIDTSGAAQDQKEGRINVIYGRLIKTIDKILDEDDLNQDGFLSYPEFAKARANPNKLHATSFYQPHKKFVQ